MSAITHLLVAEDDPISLEILLENLSDAGYAVDSAVEGDTAWALLAANPERYHAILLDRMMPGIDGIEVLRRIKADAALSHTPVIMQSGLIQPEEVLEGLRGGAYYYLTKPFAAATLLAIVETAVRDFRHTLEIRDEARKAARTLIHLEHAAFTFRTPDEARAIASLLANACPDSEKVALGLSELMLNAIEHGNLGITYQEKSQLIAAGDLDEEITRRLADLIWGERRARIEFERGEREIRFLLRDQGAGFEWLDFLEMRPERAFDTHGRGIAMAKLLSFDHLDYHGCGNELEATVRLAPR
ncbi:MAG: response regulator [Gallionellaceae bacterium]|nr:response regulator [Gallionellaceae bacterium]